MGMLTKICAVVTVFGAVNWVVLSMWSTDALQKTLGSNQNIGHAVMAVVGLAALWTVVQVVKPEKKKA